MKAFRVTVRAEDEDLATALLWEAGTSGIQTTATESGEAQLVAYFPEPITLGELETAVALLAGAQVVATHVPDVDWVARFRATFRALDVGNFRLAPVWDRPTDVPPDRCVIVVDPGRAFGTGTHETTRLCLLALQEQAQRGPLGRVADIGTGTGILAVATSRLGAEQVVAVDFDPEAIASARLHAHLNGTRLLLAQADGGRALAPRSFDLILANLMAPLLLERCDELRALGKPGATLILSGLLEGDVASVSEAYAVRPGTVEVRTDGEWAALVVRTAA